MVLLPRRTKPYLRQQLHRNPQKGSAALLQRSGHLPVLLKVQTNLNPSERDPISVQPDLHHALVPSHLEFLKRQYFWSRTALPLQFDQVLLLLHQQAELQLQPALR